MLRHLTITGDRQHGKTELLLRTAFNEAYGGSTVIYETGRAIELEDVFLRAVAMTAHDLNGLIAKIGRGAGDQHIRFVDGGKILFTHEARGEMRGVHAHVHVLDGSRGEPHVTAERVYRSALR